MTTPVLLFAPYLTMTDPVVLGPWWLGPLDVYTGPWANDRFEELVRAFLRGFRDPLGRPIERPALIAKIQSGADGVIPNGSELLALQRAIHFACLDRNPHWGGGDDNEGLWTSTSDNSEVFVWPIDLDQGRVTLTAGAMVKGIRGGYEIGVGLEVDAPKELWLPAPGPVDQEIIAAVYEVLTKPELGDRALAGRLGVAIDWLAHAWRNSPSVTPEQRVVMLKTAFDTLTDSDRTHVAAGWLEGLFGRLRQAVVDDAGCEHLLWAPSETPRRTRTWGNGETETCTDLVYWFHALGTARNDIVHKGAVSALVFEVEGSAYNGPLVHIGERLLREAIRVCLRDFGYDDLWESSSHRALKRAFEAALNSMRGEED